MNRVQNLQNQLVQVGEYDIFDHINTAPVDPILGLTLAYRADQSANKVDLGVGAYRTDDGKPYVFDIVREVDIEIAQDKKLDKEYLPIDGLAVFTKRAQELLFTADSQLVTGGKIVTVQTLSGTGALRIAFEFVNKYLHGQVYVSNPTWVTHHGIIRAAGLDFVEYPYYCPKTQGLNLNGMLETLSKARHGSIVLLHACAHNPTGIDPTKDQWLQIADVMRKRNLIPFFDSAYQGYASGDVENDAYAIRKFAELGFQMIVTQSFAKNMGLYGERCGALHFVASSKDIASRILSQVKIIIRVSYSSPPSHPALIAGRILDDPIKKQRWLTELKAMADRIITMRALLRSEIESLQVPGKWNNITDQIGMFSYTGLTPEQVEIMTKKHHIYLLKNGRISMAGVNSKNVKYIANAIADSVKSTSK